MTFSLRHTCILLFLLVGVTFGLGGIFVMPYFASANAAFYEDLLDRAGR